MDSFAASLTTGACAKKIRFIHIIKIAFFMAVFQGAMPLIGWLIGSSFKNLIKNFDHWIAFILLLAIGGKLIYEGLKKINGKEAIADPANNLLLVTMALATSIDALIIGVSFGIVNVNILMAMLVIFVATFFFSSIGVVLGKKIGNKINKGVEIFGGLVLIALGTKILIEHLYF